jgi:transcriptional regulator with XRE-family HTH domain
VITNERQYKITRAEAKRFEKALSQAESGGASSDVHPSIHAAMIDGLRSQLADLQRELDAYEALRSGRVKSRTVRSLLDLPNVLIEARIANRLTQKELAKKIGIAEQQVQRYEGNKYAGVSIERLQEVADAVGLRLSKVVRFESAPRDVSKGKKKPRASTKRRRPKPRLQPAHAASATSGARKSTARKRKQAAQKKKATTAMPSANASKRKRASGRRRPGKKSASARRQ